MAPISIFIGAMVTFLDGWPSPLPSYIPLLPCSPQLLHRSSSTKGDLSGLLYEVIKEDAVHLNPVERNRPAK